MNCLLVVNTLSGNAAKVREQTLIEKYAATDNVRIEYIRDPSDEYSVDGIDKLIVCGGDGTLNHALNLCRDRDMEVYYLPVGTFNETAKGAKHGGADSLAKLGRIGSTDFSYVAAAGSFTDIGHATKAKSKRRFKIFAYFSRVLASYKAHQIGAEIETEERLFKGTYTLIMLSNAVRCFGFRFNRLHRYNSDELQLLLIKAPKRDNLWGRIKIFFPLFRAFFLGFEKEKIGKNLTFLSVKKATLRLSQETPFCVDGEYKPLLGEQTISKETHRARVYIIKD